MQFIRKLTDPRSKPADKAKNIITLSVEEAASILCHKKKPATLNHYFVGKNTYTIPYLDSDQYYVETPPQEEYDRIFDNFKGNIVRLMEDYSDFDPLSVLYASRHGFDPKHSDKAIKISYRAFLRGWKVKYTLLPNLINAKGLAGDKDGLFDINPYKVREQLLACIHGCKGRLPGGKGEDNRVLTPITDAPFQDYLVQHFSGNEQEIVINDYVSSRKTSVSDSVASPSSTAVVSVRKESDENVFKLLECLSHDRWKHREDWRNIAFILDEEAGDHFDESFIKFSRTCPEKFDLDEVKTFLQKIHSSQYDGQKLTIATLHAMAKEDSPQIYAEYGLGGVKEKLEECVTSNGAPFRIGELFALKFGDIVKCVNAKKQSFYMFSKHRWHPSGLSAISNMLSRDVYMMFVNHSRTIGQKVANLTDDDDKQRLEQRRHATNKVANQLLNTKFKSGIITEIANLLQCPDFLVKLDSKTELVGFENGVLDVIEGTFRKGLPDDFVSISCGYDYDPIVNHPVQSDIMTFIRSCFDSSEVAQYYLDVVSSCLYGYRRFEHVWILTGTGQNGKGTTSELLKFAFGQYYAVISSAFFTRPFKDSSDATPELADKKAVRILMTSEPEASEKLQISKLKLVTGGDTITARHLYEAPFSFKPQFGIFIQANEIPALNKLDGGIQRRLRIINYPFSFTSNPSLPHEKMGDSTLKEEKLERVDWRQQFILILQNNFTQRIKQADQLDTPAIIIQSSEEYLDSNNVVKEWLSANCYITGEREDCHRPKDLYQVYKHTTESDVLTFQHWSQQIAFCGIKFKMVKGNKYYFGLKAIEM